MLKELIVDNFAGGGGASTGIEMAVGRSVDIAINHDPAAIAMHKANHPGTKHYCEDVWEVSPIEACNGRPVALAWFSPDCTHFSRAKGGTPVDHNIRGLAWVTLRWAMQVRPRVIMLENVPEIQTWGPLMPKVDPKTGRMMKIVGYGHLEKSKHGAPRMAVAEPGEVVPEDKRVMIPDPERKAETFNGFLAALSHIGLPREHPAFVEACETLKIDPDSEEAEALVKGLGYTIEYRILKSCDYGAPTSRERFYLIARSDGQPIVWPEPMYARRGTADVKSGKKKPWRSAAECIDWSLPAQSIFERKKPLAENTLRRIARGIKKFVIDNPEPFIVTVNHGGDGFRGQDLSDPLGTVTAKNGYGVVVPTIMCNNANNVGADVKSPLPTVTTGNRNYLVAPVVSAIGHTGAKDRSRPADEPVSTIVGKAEHLLVAPSIVPVGYGERKGQKPRVNDVRDPLGTVVTSGKHHVVLPTLIQYHSETAKDEVRGQTLDEPMMTLDTSNRYALSVAHIMKNYAGGYKGAGSSVDDPVGTITAHDHNSLVTAHILTLRNNQDGQAIDEPLSTVTSSGAHHAEVQAFLLKYYGNEKDGQHPADPLGTITSKDRFALVTIHGEEYIITDIRMRMLQPSELFKAQGFPDDYIIDHDAEGNPYPKTEQTKKCGNAVTPPVPCALVRANLPELCAA